MKLLKWRYKDPIMKPTQRWTEEKRIMVLKFISLKEQELSITLS